MNEPVTPSDIKYNLTIGECIRNKHQKITMVKYLLKEIDSDLVILEIDSDHPLSSEELLSYIRSVKREEILKELGI